MTPAVSVVVLLLVDLVDLEPTASGLLRGSVRCGL